jgi:hypothetical protein
MMSVMSISAHMHNNINTQKLATVDVHHGMKPCVITCSSRSQ